jgi:hypothetical protein
MKYRIFNTVYFSTIQSDVRNKTGKVVYSAMDKQFHPENYIFLETVEIPDKPTYLTVEPETWVEMSGWFYEAKGCNCKNAPIVKKFIYRVDKTVE